MTDREALWLPVLRRLTEEVDAFAVWKRVDPAFSAPEDVDAVAPLSAWSKVESVFTSWAQERNAPVVVCRHIPDTLNLFALVEDGRSLLQLEVKQRSSFRGSVQFTAEQLLKVAEVDSRGFRALRPGAEAALKLTLHGLRRGGEPHVEALAEHDVASRLQADPEGAAALALASSMATNHLRRGIAAVLEGRWDRAAMRRLERAALLRALTTPQIAVARWWFRRVVRPRCPVLQTVYRDGRRITGDVDDWLAVAARGHVVRTGNAHDMCCIGGFVAIVGPDGVGKTTVAHRLLSDFDGPRGYIYFRPPLSGSLLDLPDTRPRPRGNKNPPREPPVMGWLRLLKNLAWFWAGYLRTVRPVIRQGGLVVADRWGYGYVVQPGTLRFFGPESLARFAIKLLPQPDVVANLVAPPSLVVQRKDELTAAEVERELTLWRSLGVPRLHDFDAIGPPESTAASIRQKLCDTVGARCPISPP